MATTAPNPVGSLLLLRERPSIQLPLRKRPCMRSPSFSPPTSPEEHVVWAKLAGHSPWPARIVSDDQRTSEEAYRQADGVRKTNDDTLVHFFGTDNIAWVNRNKAVLSWNTGLQLEYNRRTFRPSKRKSKSQFEKALDEVESFLEEME